MRPIQTTATVSAWIIDRGCQRGSPLGPKRLHRFLKCDEVVDSSRGDMCVCGFPWPELQLDSAGSLLVAHSDRTGAFQFTSGRGPTSPWYDAFSTWSRQEPGGNSANAARPGESVSAARSSPGWRESVTVTPSMGLREPESETRTANSAALRAKPEATKTANMSGDRLNLFTGSPESGESRRSLIIRFRYIKCRYLESSREFGSRVCGARGGITRQAGVN